ncbi:MAG: nitroreductase [Pseudomonadota bacterium]
MDTYSGKASSEMLNYLLKRRSVLADCLSSPGPSAEQLQDMLSAASRVPDHGKLAPFYFLVFEGDARASAGDVLAEAYKETHPECPDDRAEKERARFLRAPLVVGLIMRARMSKNPLWEQMLTCGAAAQNFILAANAHGFGAQWLTEWYAYDENVRSGFGLDEKDEVAGFIYVGSVEDQPEDRDRPDLDLIVNHWEKGGALKKGDNYNREKFGYPEDGFDFSKLKRGV